MTSEELIPHLFRTEFRKITSVLCRHFGMEYMESAENIASDTFLAALEIWPYKGIPENPTAWLYAVAKNKARNFMVREKVLNEKIYPKFKGMSITVETLDIDLTSDNIYDSQLRMMFAICHPAIPVESQVGLALRILCGFGIDEIANAFLVNRETISKRLFRARQKLREDKIQLVLPDHSFLQARISSVLTTLYLLFNEGYYSESNDEILREDFCTEAMRLTYMLLENKSTRLPEVNALLALMCFHASRFQARRGLNGELILYDDQDEGLWNQELISRGAWYLHEASVGKTVSRFHIEATIAWWYTQKAESKDKWVNILLLYNQLLEIQYSPIAGLNRALAISKVYGEREGIAAAEKLQLTGNRYYFSLLGFLYRKIELEKSRKNFEEALSLTRNIKERQILERYIKKLT